MSRAWLGAIATLVLAAAGLTACQPAATVAEADHELGRKVWNYRCYFCHGYSGDARTLAATYLQPPPRDFTRTAPDSISDARLREVITQGKAGTAMKGFAGILSATEVAAVAGFVRQEFMQARAENTRYHTLENGWPDHERHRDAFGFARGEIALDTPWEQLAPEQQRGKRLFLAACVSCHDRGRVNEAGAVWETRAMSFPRDAYCTSCHAEPSGPAPHDAVHAGGTVPSSDGRRQTPPDAVAATYRVHDTPPPLAAATPQQREGERLYQRNCAFCHAADGTAKSWIGRFLEPHPRDLTDRQAMAGMTRARLRTAIADGVAGSSMPAWKGVLAPAEIEAVVAYVDRVFMPLPALP